ncbi:MAG: DUF3122 domain-containing protein, partial [Cyanobacteria bacterium P01_A01_bin.40]
MKSQPRKFLVILLASFWLCFSPQLIDMAFSASVSSEQQAIVQENDHSISNLKDEAGNVWEFVVEQEANDTYLHLVGCSLFQLDHNHPLQFSDHDQVLFEAKDLSTQESPAFYVANYSIKDILPKLPTDRILDLSFYLTGNRLVRLKISPEVIVQWQKPSKINQ